ncbi:tyrosine-type recombinase/integrase [Pacificitalea manganoxidans]|nr:integrase family protein [Pacificitalea manganoxidans]MDR6308240.1 integrase [Pacificitalea manganoxidans]
MTKSPRVRLTDANIKAAELPPGRKEAVIWDAEVRNFGLRLRENSKTYIVMYRPQGAGRGTNSKRLKIGSPATVPNVKEARNLARAALGRVAAGGDPAAERRATQQRATKSVGAMLERYDAHLARRQYVTRTDVLSLLQRRLEHLKHRDISELRGSDIAQMIERLDAADTGSKGSTFRSRLNAFLNWCTFDARVIDANPLAGYRRRRDTRAERVARTTRGRALSDAEVVAIWSAATPDTAFGRMMRFLILTGCRRNEGARLMWEMVDRKQACVKLPATFTKQARGHTVYIAPALEGVFASCAVDARGPQWVFPSPRTGQPMSGWSKIMDRNNLRGQGSSTQGKLGFVASCGVDFSLHDLRRTFRTGLSRLGIDREIAELALGHAREDLEARYNRDGCEEALRNAFAAWAGHLESAVGAKEHDVFG